MENPINLQADLLLIPCNKSFSPFYIYRKDKTSFLDTFELRKENSMFIMPEGFKVKMEQFYDKKSHSLRLLCVHHNKIINCNSLDYDTEGKEADDIYKYLVNELYLILELTKKMNDSYSRYKYKIQNWIFGTDELLIKLLGVLLKYNQNIKPKLTFSMIDPLLIPRHSMFQTDVHGFVFEKELGELMICNN